MDKKVDMSRFAVPQKEAEEMLTKAQQRFYADHPELKGKRARKRTKKKEFQPLYVMVPAEWQNRLRKARSVRTIDLALTVLAQAFLLKQNIYSSEITLSANATGLDSSSRHRAIKDLRKLGLIWTRRRGQRVPKIILKHLGKCVRWLATGE